MRFRWITISGYKKPTFRQTRLFSSIEKPETYLAELPLAQYSVKEERHPMNQSEVKQK